MRSVQADQVHDAVMRTSGEALRRWAQSPMRRRSHVRGRVTTPSVRCRPPTAATLVGPETTGACLPQAAGRSTTPSSGSPFLTKRQSAINMLGACPEASESTFRGRGQLPCHRGPDRRNHHEDWPERALARQGVIRTPRLGTEHPTPCYGVSG
jgi:hypothetical protein